MSKNILIVDDSKSVRSVIGMTLKMGGYNTLTAEDGMHALKLLKEPNTEQVDLIITDVNMPNMDGITFIRELKKIEKYSNIPICVLTTESEQEKIDQEVSKLKNAWITKPVQPAHVLDIVGGLLEE